MFDLLFMSSERESIRLREIQISLMTLFSTEWNALESPRVLRYLLSFKRDKSTRLFELNEQSFKAAFIQRRALVKFDSTVCDRSHGKTTRISQSSHLSHPSSLASMRSHLFFFNSVSNAYSTMPAIQLAPRRSFCHSKRLSRDNLSRFSRSLTFDEKILRLSHPLIFARLHPWNPTESQKRVPCFSLSWSQPLPVWTEPVTAFWSQPIRIQSDRSQSKQNMTFYTANQLIPIAAIVDHLAHASRLQIILLKSKIQIVQQKKCVQKFVSKNRKTKTKQKKPNHVAMSSLDCDRTISIGHIEEWISRSQPTQQDVDNYRTESPKLHNEPRTHTKPPRHGAGQPRQLSISRLNAVS